jgi:NitT/TauT family transport system permease protein
VTGLHRIGDVAKPLVALALVVGVWQWWATTRAAGSLVLPAPSDVWAYARENPGRLWTHTWVTLRVVFIAFAISVTAGVLVSIVFDLSPLLRDMFLPLLVVTQVTPVVAVAPLLIIWLGFGDAPKIAVAILISFFPILVNTLAGLREVPRDFSDLARSLCASKFQILRRIKLPNAVPYLFASARVSITLAIIGAVVGEFVAADAGLGFLILRGSAQLQPALMWSAVLTLALVGVVLFNAVRLLEFVAVPWRRAAPDPR